MKMNLLKPIHLLAALFLIAFAGCATSGTTRRIESPNEFIDNGKLNNQDCLIAAAKLTEDLINTVVNKSKLQVGTNGKALVIVSEIVNSTGQHLNMNMVTAKITKALDLTDKVETFTTDKKAIAEADLNDFLKDRKVTERPDYTLSGEIIQEHLTQGNKTQDTYLFQMSLNSTTRRVKVWQGEEPIIKLTKRAGAGF